MALKTKLLAFLFILLALLSLQWLLFVEHERTLLTEETFERAGILVRTLAQLASDPLASLQFSRLERQLESVKMERDVAYARVVNDKFRVMADTREGQAGWVYSGAISREFETRSAGTLVLARAPVELMGNVIGMAEIAFSLDSMREKINRNRLIFIEILAFQLLTGAAFSFLLNLQMIRPLRFAGRMLAELTPEAETHEIPVPRFSSEEISRVIRAVNAMRGSLIRFRKETVEKARLATMGKIAANMAHEIRNPLEAISGAVELIGSGGSSREEAHEYLGIIREEIRNLDDYLGEFLEFARPEPHDAKPVDLNGLIAETMLLLQPLAKKRGITIAQRLASRPIPILADGNRLKRVILNVVLNGIEACDAGGSVEVSSAEDDDGYLVSVRDDGKGIPEECRARVFEPYFTTKESGSGIGLSLSKSIVEQHGGSIRIVSGSVGGTTVAMRFPKDGNHGPDSDH